MNIGKSVTRWLMKARWYTTDLQRAESSPCQWKPADNGKGYSLSILGAINAIATWLSICLVVDTDKEKVYFKKLWW
jgi:hypothetical protein